MLGSKKNKPQLNPFHIKSELCLSIINGETDKSYETAINKAYDQIQEYYNLKPEILTDHKKNVIDSILSIIVTYYCLNDQPIKADELSKRFFFSKPPAVYGNFTTTTTSNTLELNINKKFINQTVPFNDWKYELSQIFILKDYYEKHKNVSQSSRKLKDIEIYNFILTVPDMVKKTGKWNTVTNRFLSEILFYCFSHRNVEDILNNRDTFIKKTEKKQISGKTNNIEDKSIPVKIKKPLSWFEYTDKQIMNWFKKYPKVFPIDIEENKRLALRPRDILIVSCLRKKYSKKRKINIDLPPEFGHF